MNKEEMGIDRMGNPNISHPPTRTKIVQEINTSVTQEQIKNAYDCGVRAFVFQIDTVDPDGRYPKQAAIMQAINAAKKQIKQQHRDLQNSPNHPVSIATIVDLCDDLTTEQKADVITKFVCRHGVTAVATWVSCDDDKNIVVDSEGKSLQDLGLGDRRMRHVRFLCKVDVAKSEGDAVAIATAAHGVYYPFHVPGEHSGVAKACLDNALDCIASGTPAVHVVRRMSLLVDENAVDLQNRIQNTKQAEDQAAPMQPSEGVVFFTKNDRFGVFQEAVKEATTQDAKLFVVSSESGVAARHLAKFSPQQRILAISAAESVCNALQFVYGVEPMQVGSIAHPDTTCLQAVNIAVEMGLIGQDEKYVDFRAMKEDCPAGKDGKPTEQFEFQIKTVASDGKN